MSNNVFPIRKAYDFAFKGGGKTGDIMRIVKHRNSIPKSLIDLKYGGKTQARRALTYILFKKYELWDKFVDNHWPETKTNSGKEIVEELLDDYIRNGRLEKHKDELPENVINPETQENFPL